MSTEDKALEALDAALELAIKIPRKQWKRTVWEQLREFCNEQLGERKL